MRVSSPRERRLPALPPSRVISRCAPHTPAGHKTTVRGRFPG